MPGTAERRLGIFCDTKKAEQALGGPGLIAISPRAL